MYNTKTLAPNCRFINLDIAPFVLFFCSSPCGHSSYCRRAKCSAQHFNTLHLLKGNAPPIPLVLTVSLYLFNFPHALRGITCNVTIIQNQWAVQVRIWEIEIKQYCAPTLWVRHPKKMGENFIISAFKPKLWLEICWACI